MPLTDSRLGLSAMDIDVVEVLYYSLLTLLVLVLIFSVGVRLVRRFYHFPAPSFLVGFLNNPVRRKIQSPKRIADRLDIQPGMNIVEVGPGAGTFTVEVGKRVTPSGTVCAFDISLRAIRKLRARTAKEGATNVAPVAASAYNLPIIARPADRVFMVTVLAEIPDRQRALREFARVLKPNGILSISEFLPDPDYP
ncbi:MAG: methyltransferase domain-containing protein [Candidatus Bathyarchaeia archaeon]